MTDALLSSSWYRVAQLKPRRSPHTHLHRHHYRGQLWYVLQNRSTGRCQLLTPSAHLLVGLMDGERTTHEIWEEAARQLGDDCPTQDETIRLLGTLYLADGLACHRGVLQATFVTNIRAGSSLTSVTNGQWIGNFSNVRQTHAHGLKPSKMPDGLTMR